MHQQQTAFENNVGKGEIAHNEQFLLFPQCFRLNKIIISLFIHIYYITSLYGELEEPKIGILGKGLRKKTLWKKYKILNIGVISIFRIFFKQLSPTTSQKPP